MNEGLKDLWWPELIKADEFQGFSTDAIKKDQITKFLVLIIYNLTCRVQI
jgi:hypothetical protein